MRQALFVLFLASAVGAQQPEQNPSQQVQPAPADQAARSASNAEQPPQTVTVPAGTKVLLALRNPITTKSARVGDGVYLQTAFPVTINDQIVIPAGTFVQGNITHIKRAGKVKGRAELLMHFTTMIYPNGYTVTLPGAVDSISGAEDSRVSDPEGKIKAEPTKGRDMATIGTVGASGAGVGAMAGGVRGAGIGALAGAAAGTIATLFTRGQDVRIEQGTSVEMVLQRPLVLQEERIARAGVNYVPIPNEAQPRRQNINERQRLPMPGPNIYGPR